jgi:predicted RNA-binding protein
MKHSQDFPRFYVLVGEENNWKISLANNIWGFVEKSKGLWNKIEINEFLAFYVTSPTKRIIGFGQVTEKFIDEELVWPMEKFGNKAIWKYRMHFKPICIVDDWNYGIMIKKNIMLMSSRTVVSKDTFFKFVKDAEIKWGEDLLKEIKKQFKELQKSKGSEESK